MIGASVYRVWSRILTTRDNTSTVISLARRTVRGMVSLALYTALTVKMKPRGAVNISLNAVFVIV
jgi:hypothetical protein